MAIATRSLSTPATAFDSVLPFSYNDNYDWFSNFGRSLGSDDKASDTSASEEDVSTLEEAQDSQSSAMKGQEEDNVCKNDFMINRNVTEVPGIAEDQTTHLQTSNHCDAPFDIESSKTETSTTNDSCGTTFQSSKTDEVKQTDTKTLDARPKEFHENKNKTQENRNDSDDIQKTKSKKKKDQKKKIREKKQKKWRMVDPEELGFHISLLPTFCEDADNSEDTFTDANSKSNEESPSPESDENLSGACCLELCQEQDGCASDSVTQEPADEDFEDADDVTYFKNLGIDVTDDANVDRCDDLIDWDGIRFDTDSFPRVATRSKPPSTKAIKTTVLTQPLKPSTSTANKSEVDKTPSSTFDQNWETPPMPKLLNKYDAKRLYELECSSKRRIYVRRDRHRRAGKIHKEIKTKHCQPGLFNPSKKKVYIHHRLYKLLGESSLWACKGQPKPMPKYSVNHHLRNRTLTCRSGHNCQPHQESSRGPVQDLSHAIDANSTPSHMETDLASFLVSLQHREMTPEDYEMLLRLDDSVKPKTVSENFLDKLRTEVVPSSNVASAGGADEAGSVLQECSVCMEPYEAGQVKKYLPCGHGFHSECIDMWLRNSSMNCPLDGLPVDDS